MSDDLRESYRVLELDADSSPEAVKRSYRDLVKLWHPDRYSPGSPLQHKAQERLKEINLAYERIIKKPRAVGSDDPPPKSAHAAPSMAEETPRRKRSWADEDPEEEPVPESGESPPAQPVSEPADRPEASESASPNPEAPANEAPSPPSEVRHRTARWAWISAGAALLAAGIGGAHWLRRPVKPVAAAPVASVPSVNGGASKAAPRPVASGEAPPAEAGAPASKATPSPELAAPSTSPLKLPIEIPEMAARLGYFTAGSTKAEVLSIQGKPDSFTNSAFQYGSSMVFFRDDRVDSWRDGFPALKARMFAELASTPLDYFTVGSSKDEVIAAQGKPDRFTAAQFQYGSSLVRFDRDRVVSWQDGSTPLRARILRPLPAENLGYFTVGSTKDSVVAVQGLPDQFTATEFQYGSSAVYFKENKVVGWQMGSPPLKVRPAPAAP